MTKKNMLFSKAFGGLGAMAPPPGFVSTRRFVAFWACGLIALWTFSDVISSMSMCFVT